MSFPKKGKNEQQQRPLAIKRTTNKPSTAKQVSERNTRGRSGPTKARSAGPSLTVKGSKSASSKKNSGTDKQLPDDNNEEKASNDDTDANAVADPVDERATFLEGLRCRSFLIQVNHLFKELEGFESSDDYETLEKQCITAIQHFKFARETMTQQLSIGNNGDASVETIPSLIRMIADAEKQHRHSIDAMRTSHGKHLVHCKQIRLDKMKAEFKVKLHKQEEERLKVEEEYVDKFAKQDDDKKKIILEKFTLGERVTELEECLKDAKSLYRRQEKQWNEERKITDKELRQKTQDLFEKERENFRLNQEWKRNFDTLKRQTREAEVKLEKITKDKKELDKENEDLKNKIQTFNTSERCLNSTKRERDKLYLKVHELENENTKLREGDTSICTDDRVIKIHNELEETKKEKRKLEEDVRKLRSEPKQKKVTIKLECTSQEVQTDDIELSELLNEQNTKSSTNNMETDHMKEQLPENLEKIQPQEQIENKIVKSKGKKRLLKNKTYNNPIPKQKNDSTEEDSDVEDNSESVTQKNTQVTYTMRGKYESIIKDKVRCSYTMEKFLGDSCVSEKKTKKSGNQTRSGSRLSTDTSLSEVSTKVNHDHAFTEDLGVCSAKSERSLPMSSYSMASVNSAMTKNTENSNTNSNPQIVCNTLIQFNNCAGVSLKQQ